MTTARWDEDEKLACPGCLEGIEPADLCGHDGTSLGPLCLGLCCGYHHEQGAAA